MILVVCAVAEELRGFTRDGVDVVAVGVGPVEAAIGTQRALAARPYRAVVNAGIGGAFASRAAVGDAVIVTADTYVELGREDRTPLSLPRGMQLVERVECDGGLLAHAATLAATQPFGALTCGTAVTSATITTSAARAAALAARHAAAVESMEGFAVLRAAAANAIAAIELRGISNIVGDRATSGWNFRAGAAAATGVLNAFLDVVQTHV